MRAVELFLHICNSEQRRRFLERAQRLRQALEVLLRRRREQRHWDAYQRAYEAMLRSTSTADEPRYACPGRPQLPYNRRP